MFKKSIFVLGVLVIAALALAACQPAPPSEPETITVVETVVVVEEGETVVEEKEVTVIETVEVPAEMASYEVSDKFAVEKNWTPIGGWLSSITMVVEPSDLAAVTRLAAGDIDIYAYTVANPEAFQATLENGLQYVNVYGSSTDLTFNPAGPTFEATGKLNPFSSNIIRQATSMLIDRNYIVQEIMGGLALPRYTPLAASVPDYARYVATVRAIEARFAYNPEKAAEMIDAEMKAMGATGSSAGGWRYEGEAVEVIFLIRIEDERRQIGDYIANQLETVGFTVVRDYKSSSEASPLWIFGNMHDGLWHLYTGGWGASGLSRDNGWVFEFFYSPKSGYGFSDLWQNYEVSDECDVVYTALSNNDFTNFDERDVLFAQGLECAADSSVRFHLTDKLSFVPYASRVSTAYDLAAGVASGQVTRWTIKTDDIGGDLVFAMPDLLVDAWNPLAGSNWVYDISPELMTNDEAVTFDPYTGLGWPQRVESVVIEAQEGLPINQTLDWMDFSFVPEIVVPDDAWSDWDAENQVFITAGERFTETATAKVKSVCTYPADLFETVYWHDGTPLSVADFVMGMIMPWDAAMEASEIYDASQTPNYEAGIEAFKGWRITSTDPLVVEWYSDNYALDASLNFNCGWPDYGYGDGAWHMMAVGYLADAAGDTAFSASKAQELEVEWMNYVSGPAMGVLSFYLDEAFDSSFIPYEPTLGQFLTAEEAAQAYYNYKTWFKNHGHFWIGTGPYFLDQVFPVEKTLTLKHNPYYPDEAGKWDRFAEAKVAVVEVDGPGVVAIGEEAAFDVYVDFAGAPYPADEISGVKYLVFDATGNLLLSGEAANVADGQYSIALSVDETATLTAGANKLEVAVVSKLVALPGFGTLEFITE